MTRTMTIVAGSAGLFGLALLHGAPTALPLTASIIFMLLAK